jgi:ATP-binding cassette subfamily F protein 3
MLLLKPANLLILDEPTNHLDLSSKEVLLGALKDFPGTVIFVSHDRHFIANLATAVLEVKGGSARFFPGDYDYYLRRIAQEQSSEAGAAAGPAPEVKTATDSQRERQEEKRMKSELRALEKEEGALMIALEEMESRRRQIEESMAQPEVYSSGERMRELRREHEENAEAHAKAMAQWEGLDMRLNGLKEGLSRLRSDKAGL